MTKVQDSVSLFHKKRSILSIFQVLHNFIDEVGTNKADIIALENAGFYSLKVFKNYNAALFICTKFSHLISNITSSTSS